MHVRFLVTFNTGDAATSEEAREHVFNTLLAEGFANQVGRWNAGLADWFVIGGRWSGAFTRALLDKEKLETVEKEFERKHGWWLGGQEHMTEKQRRQQMKKILAQYGFQGVDKVAASEDGGPCSEHVFHRVQGAILAPCDTFNRFSTSPKALRPSVRYAGQPASVVPRLSPLS